MVVKELFYGFLNIVWAFWVYYNRLYYIDINPNFFSNIYRKWSTNNSTNFPLMFEFLTLMNERKEKVFSRKSASPNIIVYFGIVCVVHLSHQYWKTFTVCLAPLDTFHQNRMRKNICQFLICGLYHNRTFSFAI